MIVIGHRGAPGYKGENTLGSFQKAIDMGVDMVECDVHLTRDGQLVIMHDFTIDRTTDGKGDVSIYSFEELRNFKTKDGQSIPTLRELLDLVDGRCDVLIELKGENTARGVAQLIDEYVLNMGWRMGQFTVQSFNFTELRAFKKLMPSVAIATLNESKLSQAQYAEEVGASATNIYIGVLTEGYVADAHRRGLKMNVWGVNEPSGMEQLKLLGVDGVITDYPDIIKKTLTSKIDYKEAYLNYASAYSI